MSLLPRPTERGSRTTKYQPRPDRIKDQYALYLPDTVVYRQLYAQARKAGVEATGPDNVRGRMADNTIQETVVIHSPDERRAKYDKPEAVYSMAPGRPAVILWGNGTTHTGEMLEELAEIRHYGQDIPQRQNELPNMQDLWVQHVERQVNYKAGRRTYFDTRGLLDSNGR